MNAYGYEFYFDTSDGVIVFPITPGELTIKSGSNNTTVSLIDEGEVNILKAPSLTEIEFEARFPMRKYPYSREVKNFKKYFDTFTKLKENKESFRFIVTRTTPGGKKLWDTNLLVSLEELETNESADEGDDVIVSFSLKQYKEYGVKFHPLPENEGGTGDSNSNGSTSGTTSTSPTRRGGSITTPIVNEIKSTNGLYVVKKYDTLAGIAKLFGLTIAELREMNSQLDLSSLGAGMRLRVVPMSTTLNSTSTTENKSAGAGTGVGRDQIKGTYSITINRTVTDTYDKIPTATIYYLPPNAKSYVARTVSHVGATTVQCAAGSYVEVYYTLPPKESIPHATRYYSQYMCTTSTNVVQSSPKTFKNTKTTSQRFYYRVVNFARSGSINLHFAKEMV